MGCGAITTCRPAELLEQERETLKDFEKFRQRIIAEVVMTRMNLDAKAARSSAASSAEDQDVSGRRDSNHSSASWACLSSKNSTDPCRSSSSSLHSSFTEDPIQTGAKRQSVESKASKAKLNRQASSASTFEGLKQQQDEWRASQRNRPFKRKSGGNGSMGHRVSCPGEYVHELTLSVQVPGKVGQEDEAVAVDASNMILKTRKVHKHKNHAKKVYAQRRLGSIDFDEDEDDSDKEQVAEENKLPAIHHAQLLAVVDGHFLFSSLQKSEREMLLDHMTYQENNEGDDICVKGQKGDACYIIISGQCIAMRDTTKVADFNPGHIFGELAILYDVPRTATVKCSSDNVKLGVIHGHTFRRSLAIAKERTLGTTLDYLSRHKIFSKLVREEKVMLANALNSQNFEPGAMMIAENLGCTVEWMFLVQEGSVEVRDEYNNQKMLGEGATISGKNMPYGNQVVCAKAVSNVRCLSISYTVINRLFGNISEVLRVSTIRSFLDPLSFFKALTEKQQMIVAGQFQDQKVRKGELIVSASADPQLVVVMEGEVSVFDAEAEDGEDLLKSSPSGRVEMFRDLRNSPNRSVGDFGGAFANVMTSKQVTDTEPEMEPPSETRSTTSFGSGRSGRESTVAVAKIVQGALVPGELKRLCRGDVHGEATFKEFSRMEHFLAARTDAVICRSAYDNVCRALRGQCEATPNLSWVLLRNQAKEVIRGVFPFSALYEDTLDLVVEGFQKAEYAAGDSIIIEDEEKHSFFIVIEGSAVSSHGTEAPKTMEKWSTYGTRQLLLGVPNDDTVRSGPKGCVVLIIAKEAFTLAAGVLCHELQTKMFYQDLNITMNDLKQTEILGKGQFGVVRRIFIEGVEDVPEGFALKSMSKKRILELEQAAACKLEREILVECCHPLIVRLVASFQDPKDVHLLMETLEGGDLFTAIRDIGTLAEDHALFFGASICLSIEYIHSRGIVYRDLKPENIMLTADGFVKLVDFGCCTRKVRSYTFTGTPEYLAPEVILGKGYGKAVDWWSLGVIMYEMICGPLPFGDTCTDPLAVMKEVLEKEVNLPYQVSEVAGELLMALLERMPEQRLGSSTKEWRSEVRNHTFFEDLDWDAIIDQSTNPPYVPPRGAHNRASAVSMESSDCDELPTTGGELMPLEPQALFPSESELPEPGSDLSWFTGF